jgi:hypothetical protein
VDRIGELGQRHHGTYRHTGSLALLLLDACEGVGCGCEQVTRSRVPLGCQPFPVLGAAGEKLAEGPLSR